jgi:hypothetical protein
MDITKIARVCIGGDVFRFEGGQWHQRHNVAIMEVIAAMLMPGKPVEALTPERLGIRPPANELRYWLRSLSTPPSARLQSTIIKEVSTAGYLGFETPEPIWDIVSAHAAVAVDLRLHPVRFGRDLLLLVRSNRSLPGGPFPSVVSGLEVARKMLMVRARTSAAFPVGPVRSPSAHAALLALQCPFDSALVREGSLVGLEDYADALSARCAAFDTVLVRAHPLQEPTEATWRAVLQQPSAWISSDNSYALLTAGGVSEVISLSSSLLHEASALGLRAHALDEQLSHGFPVRSEYTSLTLQDLVQAFAADGGLPAGQGMLPRLEELFGRPAADAHALDLRETAAVITPGRLTGADPRLQPAFGHGWYGVEAWGRWSASRVGVLNFTWPDGRTEALDMALGVGALPRTAAKPAAVEVWSGGRMLLRQRLSADAIPTAVCFTVPRPARGEVFQLALLGPEPLAPPPLGGVQDPRRLGLSLSYVETAP